MKRKNPLMNHSFSTNHNAIPFLDIQEEDYIPAIKKAILEAQKSIDQITLSQNTDFNSVIEALEFSFEKVEMISGLFSNLIGAESDDSFKERACEFLPMVSVFLSKVYTNSDLFNKIKQVYEQSQGIQDKEDRIMEKE
ncbi:MAG TPA: hypothetical protein ENO01_02650 [Candidatus Marinimicrobia bacterium]|nr:hypothetical protein [Candidatus Neomarinimicrobiota bacterium]